MKYSVMIEFEVDTEEFRDVETEEDVSNLAVSMMHGDADFPDENEVGIYATPIT